MGGIRIFSSPTSVAQKRSRWTDYVISYINIVQIAFWGSNYSTCYLSFISTPSETFYYFTIDQVRSGSHPEGPSGHGCCSDVFRLSLSPTSSSSLTRFRPVVIPYNGKPALFKSFSMILFFSSGLVSINRLE